MLNSSLNKCYGLFTLYAEILKLNEIYLMPYRDAKGNQMKGKPLCSYNWLISLCKWDSRNNLITIWYIISIHKPYLRLLFFLFTPSICESRKHRRLYFLLCYSKCIQQIGFMSYAIDQDPKCGKIKVI